MSGLFQSLNTLVPTSILDVNFPVVSYHKDLRKGTRGVNSKMTRLIPVLSEPSTPAAHNSMVVVTFLTKIGQIGIVLNPETRYVNKVVTRYLWLLTANHLSSNLVIRPWMSWRILGSLDYKSAHFHGALTLPTSQERVYFRIDAASSYLTSSAVFSYDIAEQLKVTFIHLEALDLTSIP